MEIEQLEKELKEHIIFVYNNLSLGDISMIDGELVNQLYERFKKLRKYERINVVLQTGGGNLSAGTRIINLLKKMYSSYEVTILDRCHSTGTFIALSADKIKVIPKTVITPCEPQMMYDGESISTSLIRNLIENYRNVSNIIKKVDPKIIGDYYATVNYFKDICYQIYEHDRAELIIDYMLNKVNSHQYPITFEQLRLFGIPIIEISKTDECNFYEWYSNQLLKEFYDVKIDDELESRITLISDYECTTAHCKKYSLKEQKKYKIFDNYRVIERR